MNGDRKSVADPIEGRIFEKLQLLRRQGRWANSGTPLEWFGIAKRLGNHGIQPFIMALQVVRCPLCWIIRNEPCAAARRARQCQIGKTRQVESHRSRFHCEVKRLFVRTLRKTVNEVLENPVHVTTDKDARVALLRLLLDVLPNRRRLARSPYPATVAIGGLRLRQRRGARQRGRRQGDPPPTPSARR